MEKFKNLRPLKKASLVLLLVLALTGIIPFFNVLANVSMRALFKSGAFDMCVMHLLCFVGAVSIGFGIWEEKRSSHVWYGYGAFVIASLVKFVYMLKYKWFHVYSYSYSYFSGYSKEYEFSVGALFLGIIVLLAYVVMFIYAYINSNKKGAELNQLGEKLKYYFEKLWYVPFVALVFVEAVAIYWNLFGDSRWSGSSNYISLQYELFIAIFVLMSLIWKYKDGIKRKEKTPGEVVATGGKLSYRAQCGIVKLILLSVFTLGIWPMIWVYRMTDELNCVKGFEYRNPATKLLLFIFVPFYMFYWFYQTALRVDALAKEEDVHSDIAMLSLVFSMCFPIGSMLLIQDKVNKIVVKNAYEKYNIVQ